MTFWARLQLAVRYCTYLSILSNLAAILLFSLYIIPTLYPEYKSDSPLDPTSPSTIATFERFLHPERWNINSITTYNYKAMLRLSDDQNWIRKDHRHSWIYITGNQSCPSKANCERFEAAFDKVIPAFYVKPPADNASVFVLNCDTSPFLCQGWAATPPALIRLESLGFPYCRISNDPLPSLRCSYGARYIPLPSTKELTKGTYRPVDGVPDEKWQLRSLLDSTCTHEAYSVRRLLEHVGNGGRPMGFSGFLGDLITGYGIAELYGMLFSWWLGEGSR
jgi:hypothetical protein